MTARTLNFINAWIDTNAENGPPHEANTYDQARDLAEKCIAGAHAEGISVQQLENAVGDPTSFVATLLTNAWDCERYRLWKDSFELPVGDGRGSPTGN